jgi:hypothetical protein
MSTNFLEPQVKRSRAFLYSAFRLRMATPSAPKRAPVGTIFIRNSIAQAVRRDAAFTAHLGQLARQTDT